MWIASLLGLIGSAVSGFFGFKKSQADALTGALGAVGEMNASDAQYATASATAIQAVYENGPPIERLWRPCLMWIIVVAIVSRWFGYQPPHMPQEEVMVIYNWLEIGLIGYIPLRSMEKIMKGFQIGSVLKTFISKKLL